MYRLVATALLALSVHGEEWRSNREAIVGGVEIDVSEAPHMAAIVRENRTYCGGSIVGDRHIVTAAHCLFDVSSSELLIRVGSSYATSQGKVYTIENMQMHEKFSPYALDYDVAFIRLNDTITFNKNASKIALSEVAPETGKPVRTSGWGLVQENGQVASKLRTVMLNVVDWEACNRAYGEILTKRMICAGAPGKDSCQGDSGGPLDADGKLVGIVSFGQGCARPSYPGVYTNVADPEILSFIRHNLNITGNP